MLTDETNSATSVSVTARDTITRDSGSWILDGFRPGQFISVAGTDDGAGTSNDDTFEIFDVTDAVITLAESSNVVTQADLTGLTITAEVIPVGNIPLISIDPNVHYTPVPSGPAIPTLTITESDPNDLTVPDTITRSSGSWVSDGFLVGQTIVVEGTASNDGTFYITDIDATETVLTLGDGLSLTTETTSTAVVFGLRTIHLTEDPSTSQVPDLTFADTGGNDTITRSQGSWVDDGFLVGQTILIDATTSNDGTYTIDSVDVDQFGQLAVLTLSSADLLANETASGASVVSLDNDSPVTTAQALDPLVQGTLALDQQLTAKILSAPDLLLAPLTKFLSLQGMIAGAEATVTIGNQVNITAQGNVSITADANAKTEIAAPATLIAATFAGSRSVAEALVMNGASITAGGDFELTANSNNTLDATTGTVKGITVSQKTQQKNIGNQNNNPAIKNTIKQPNAPAIVVSFGFSDSISEAGVESGASIAAENITVNADNENDFRLSSKSKIIQPKKNTGQAIVTNIAIVKSDANAHISGDATATLDANGTGGNITVDARSININNDSEVKAITKDKPPQAERQQNELQKELVKEANKEASGQNNNQSGQNQTSKSGKSKPPGKLGISAAVNVVISSNEATAYLGIPAAAFYAASSVPPTIVAAGDLSVTAYAEDNFKTITVGKSGAGAEFSIGGAISVTNYINHADAFVENALVDAGKALTVNAESKVPDQFELDSVLNTLAGFNPNIPNLQFNTSSPAAFFDSVVLQGEQALDQDLSALGAILPVLKLNLGVPDKVATSYVIASAKAGTEGSTFGGKQKGKLAAAAMVNVRNVDNAANAYIGQGAVINSDASVATSVQSVAVVALASITTVNINGFKSIKQFNPLGSGFATTKSKEGSAVGASIMVLEENNRAHAYIDDGAVVNAANNVAVAADTKSLLITVNISGSKAKDLGITGTFSLNSASNDARAYIEDQAIVTAGSDVTVNANNETVAVSVSGATSAAEKLGIGVSVNVNNVNDIAHAFIGNFEPTLTGEPELTFADNATTANLSFKDATLSGNPTLTFTDNGSDGDTITRASGSGIADGFDLDQSIQVSGSAGNDGTYQIGSISTDGATLTLDFQDTLSDEPNAAGIAVTGQDTLTRNDTGSWIDDGFLAGDAITVTGSGTNNGTYLIDAISDDGLILTLDSVDTLTDEPNAAAVTVATQDTITRNRGSWIIDGFQAGDSIAATGSTNNDATYSIDSISADGRTLTLGTADTLTDDTDQGVSVVAPTGPAPVAGTVTTTSTVTPLTVSPTLTFTDIALKGGPLPSLTVSRQVRRLA